MRPGDAGIGERAGDGEEADEQQQQRPVDRRDHGAAGELAVGEQQRGDEQAADLARQPTS